MRILTFAKPRWTRCFVSVFLVVNAVLPWARRGNGSFSLGSCLRATPLRQHGVSDLRASDTPGRTQITFQEAKPRSAYALIALLQPPLACLPPLATAFSCLASLLTRSFSAFAALSASAFSFLAACR